MKEHSMGLATNYFDMIKNGTKTIECRLFDDKRKELQIGDIIEFSDAQDSNRKTRTKIIKIHRFESFHELLIAFPIHMFGGENQEQFLGELRKFYSEEKEREFGVVGIEIALI